MSDNLDRRTVLKGVAVSAVALGSISEAAANPGEALTYDEAKPFSYDLFKARARELANGPYAPPPRPAPEVVQKINYEEWGKIKFRTEAALFADGPGRFPFTFFHLGLFFQKAVDMHVVEGGQSKRIVYEQAYFDMPADSIARQLPHGRGLCRAAAAGGARRRARLAQERLGRLSRRRLFPRDRRIASIWPLRARRRARRRGRRPAGGIPRLHQFLYRLAAGATTR